SHEEDTVEVGVDDVEPQVIVDIRGDATAAAAGVVHEDVDRTVPVDGGTNEGTDVAAVPHVTSGAVDVEALLLEELDRRRHPVGGAGADEHLMAPMCQRTGNREADAARGSGYERDQSILIGHSFSLHGPSSCGRPATPR